MNKAQAFSITLMFELLFAGILGATLGWLLVGGHASITQISTENMNERHALALANIFNSHPNITYFDGYQFHRDMLDKEKLDNLMVKKQDFIDNWQEKIYPNIELSKNFSSPDSYNVIIVLDLETDDAWIMSLNGTTEKFNLDDFLDCLKKEIKAKDMPKLFELDSNLHEILKIEKCEVSLYSKILDYGFPVTIRYSDYDIHTGLVKVMVVEWVQKV